MLTGYIWLDELHNLPLNNNRPRSCKCLPRATMQTAYVQVLLLFGMVFVTGTVGDFAKRTVSSSELNALRDTLYSQDLKISKLRLGAVYMGRDMDQQQRTIDEIIAKKGKTTIHAYFKQEIMV